MDVIGAAILTAIASGMLSGVGDASKKFIVDTYEALKAAIKQSFG